VVRAKAAGPPLPPKRPEPTTLTMPATAREPDASPTSGEPYDMAHRTRPLPWPPTTERMARRPRTPYTRPPVRDPYA